MFSDPNLDAPPPQSQFRRPWSPEPYDPYSSSSATFSRLQQTHRGRQDQQQQDIRSFGTSPHRQQRREGSDASVEALDLADYARTLRMRQAEDPYPPFPSQLRQQNTRPPSSFPVLVPSLNSRDSLAIPPPSLVSRGLTLSSNATHQTISSAPRSTRRPFSIPATPGPLSTSYASSSRGPLHPGPYIVEPDTHPAPSEEIDISRFPKWSRNWYNANNPSAPVAPAPDVDIYTPLPASQLESARMKSLFDPGYRHDPYNSYNPYDLPPPALSSVGHDSRDMLPWSNDPPEYGPSLDPMLKEERMRMLEREFGSKAKGKSKDISKALVDEDGKPLVGTIDEKGRLVTTGPKRRVVVRTLQILLAIGASIPAIYAAVAIKPADPKNPPPPANKPPVFVLYILSSVTLLTLLYMFVFRPCCCVRPRSQSKHPLGGAANMGMMVLPVGPPRKKNKKEKGGHKGKGKYGPPGAQDVQVNLIVDPGAFHPPEASDSESDDEGNSLDEAMMPGGYGGYDNRQKHDRRKKRNRNRRRRGVFEGLAMEEEWRAARSWAKKVAAVDVAGLVFWGATFVFIMTGKKCPSGGFNGWCNAYNVSTACACLLCLTFGVTTFFDVQDLHASKQSPRTRS
ncbi:hypothetical protein BDZ97DRAFT_1794745 [Flammula alnicola]|nr:hypothetical protein BDZ97DRAFT_1794745 [Flammula alnicola]